jgi:hypothetical protein
MVNLGITHKFALDGEASKLASLRLIGILCNLHEHRRDSPPKSLPDCAKIGGQLATRTTEDKEAKAVSRSNFRDGQEKALVWIPILSG